jgi:orotate phosphoribosyltransferase
MNMAALAQSDWQERKRVQLYEIIKDQSLKQGRFQLASGGTSDLYFEMKATLLDPEGLDLASDLIIDILNQRFPNVDAIGGLVIGACPVVTAVCLKSRSSRRLPGFFVRRERKSRGTGQLIDGPVKPGSNVVLLDDVTTTGGSVQKAIDAVREELDCNVLAVITVVDREQGAKESFAKNGLELIPLYLMTDFK